MNSKEELLTALQEQHGSGIATMSDIVCPTSKFMMQYFLSVLPYIGIDIQKMIQECTEKLSHDGINTDVLPYIVVYNTVRDVFPAPKLLEKFSVMSLLEPKPSDIVYVELMSNFSDYMGQRTLELLEPYLKEELEPLQQELFSQEQLAEELQHKINNCEANLCMYTEELAKAEEQLPALGPEVEQLEQELKKLQMELEAEEAEIEALDVELQSNGLQLTEIVEKQQLDADRCMLEGELATLQQRNAEQESVLTDKRTALLEKASKRVSIEESIEHEEQKMRASEEAIALSKELEEMKKVLLEQQSKMEDLKKELQSTLSNIESLDAQNAAKEKEIASTKENLMSLEKSKIDNEKDVKRIQSLIKTAEEECKTLDKKRVILDRQIEEREQQIENLKEIFNREHGRLCDKMEELKVSYMKNVEKRFKQKWKD